MDSLDVPEYRGLSEYRKDGQGRVLRQAILELCGSLL